MKRLARVLAVIISVVLLAISVLVALPFSQSGFALLVEAGQKLSQGRLQIGNVKGSLAREFSLQKISFSSPAADIEVAGVNFTWKPRQLFRGNLSIATCLVTGVDVEIKESGESKPATAFSLPDFALPLAITLGEIRGQEIRVFSGGAAPFSLKTIHLQLEARDDRIDLKSFGLQGEGFVFELQGNIATSGTWPVEAKGHWRYEVEGLPPMDGEVKLSDSLAEGDLLLALNSPVRAGIKSRFRLSDTISWKSKLEAESVDPSVFVPELRGELDFLASVEGRMEENEVVVDYQVDHLKGKLLDRPLELKLSGNVEGEDVKIDALELHSDGARLQLNGTVGATLKIDYALDVPNVSSLYPEIAGTLKSSGSISGDIASPMVRAKLSGRDLAAAGVLASTFQASYNGEVTAEGKADFSASLDEVKNGSEYLDRIVMEGRGSLDKHFVKLELQRDQLEVVSGTTGGVVGKGWKGVVDRLDIHHESRAGMSLVKPAELEIGADKARLQDLCLEHPLTGICLSGRLEEKKWWASADFSGLDPSYIFTEWPGSLRAELRGHGDFGAAAPSHVVEIVELSGQLKGQDVEGRGEVELNSDVLVCDDLHVRYGEATVSAHGRLDEEYDFALSADIPDIKAILPEMRGALEIETRLGGSRETPVLDLELVAEDGDLGGVSFSGFQADVRADLQKDGVIDADIAASDLIAGATKLMEVSLKTDGTVTAHSFSLQVQADPGNVLIRGKGGYADKWAGEIEHLDLDLKQYGDWRLKTPARLVAGQEESGLSSFCLHHQQAEVCLDGSLDRNQRWSVESTVKALPLSLLSEGRELPVWVRGKSESRLAADGQGAEVERIDGRIELVDLQIGDRQDERLRYDFSGVSLAAVSTGQDLVLELEAIMEKKGRLRGNVTVGNLIGRWSEAAELPMTGELRTDIDDLSLVTILSGARVRPEGRLRGHFTIAGTASSPELTGGVDLEEGQVEVADLGITLKEVSGHLVGTDKKVDFEVAARSGPGSLQGEGVLESLPGGGIQVQSLIRGSDFEVMATEEYLLHISPEIRLRQDLEGTRLEGRVHILHGRIVLEESSGGVSPSKDVVLVDTDAEEKTQERNLFFMNLEVDLGEDVQIDAYGLKSRVVGNITLTDSPGTILKAQGELDVEDGRFTLYTAKLDISRGRLFFSGGAVENPGVDFQAQRAVGDKIVGVEVTGTAQDLHFEFFSDPAMDESEILSYMLVGRSMYGSSESDTGLVEAAARSLGLRGVNTVTGALKDYLPIDEIYIDGSAGSGDVSIVLGKYITEDLFIGYDHNFFDSIGEFKARYDLGYNFSVETKSSVKATSGDIIYTIKK